MSMFRVLPSLVAATRSGARVGPASGRNVFAARSSSRLTAKVKTLASRDDPAADTPNAMVHIHVDWDRATYMANLRTVRAYQF